MLLTWGGGPCGDIVVPSIYLGRRDPEAHLGGHGGQDPPAGRSGPPSLPPSLGARGRQAGSDAG